MRINDLEESFIREANSAARYDRQLRVGAINAVYESSLYPPLSRFFKEHTDVSLKVVLGHSIDLLQMLQDSIIDVAFSYLPLKKAGFVSRRFSSDRLVLLASPAVNAYKKGIRKEELISCEYLMCNFAFGEAGEFVRSLFPPRHAFRFEIDNSGKVAQYLTDGLGYSFLPYKMAERLIAVGRLEEIKPLDFTVPEIVSYCVYRRGNAWRRSWGRRRTRYRHKDFNGFSLTRRNTFAILIVSLLNNAERISNKQENEEVLNDYTKYCFAEKRDLRGRRTVFPPRAPRDLSRRRGACIRTRSDDRFRYLYELIFAAEMGRVYGAPEFVLMPETEMVVCHNALTIFSSGKKGEAQSAGRKERLRGAGYVYGGKAKAEKDFVFPYITAEKNGLLAFRITSKKENGVLYGGYYQTEPLPFQMQGHKDRHRHMHLQARAVCQKQYEKSGSRGA